MSENPAASTTLETLEPYQALIEFAPVAIVVTGADGRIALLNQQAEELFGYPRAELLGQSIEVLIPEGLQADQAKQPAGDGPQPGQRLFEAQKDLLVRCKDGREFPAEISLKQVDTRQGSFVTCIVRDASQRRAAELALRKAYEELEGKFQERTAELQAAYQELQARNEELDAFNHTVAHDLKSQLTLITGYAEVLREQMATIPQEQQLRYLESIARNGYKMARVVEALLLLASVRQSQIEKWPLQMDTIVAEAQERLAYELATRGAHISLPERWPQALGNGPLLEEVWINYISNGLKYGGSPPQLELGATPQPDGMVKFWVKDNGPGLTEEQQAELFKPFSRLGKGRASGSGLGLSIVRRIVERLEGEVGVESQPGQGSLFYFKLPAAK